MNATELYLVIASSGEYDDYREWVVAAFNGRAHAENHAQHAYVFGQTASEHLAALDLDWDNRERWVRLNLSPYDPNWEPSIHQPTAYKVQTVALLAEPLTTRFQPKRFRKKRPSEDPQG